MFKPKKAFTLIELLVVIAIIGILATISVLALSNARAKSRDAKRAGDVKQIQTALELFFNDMNRYPTVAEFNSGSIFSTSTNGNNVYMVNVPTAPTPADSSCAASGNAYSYNSSPDGSSYTLSYCLGGQTGSMEPGDKCATPGGIINGYCDTVYYQNHDYVCGTNSGDVCLYNVVKIGSQYWLRENLDIGQMITSAVSTDNQTNNGVIEKYCYNNDPANCEIYGGLYQWGETVQYLNGASNTTNWSPAPTGHVQGVCPDGWHIPTDDEQHALDLYLTDPGQTCNPNRVHAWDCATASTKLQLGGSSGFDGMLSGNRNPDGTFGYPNDYNLWSSSVYSTSTVWARLILRPGYTTVERNAFVRTPGFSVRCVKD